MLFGQSILPTLASLSTFITCNAPANPELLNNYYVDCEYKEGNTVIALSFVIDFTLEDREPLIQSFGGYMIRNVENDLDTYIPVFQELMDRNLDLINESLGNPPGTCFNATVSLPNEHVVSFPSGFTPTDRTRGDKTVFERVCSN